MPSIDSTFCDNKECPLRENCWRFVGIKHANKSWCSMAHFEPEDGKCDAQIPIEVKP